MIPGRRVLLEAEALNAQLGHENLGFLSATHGFMPRTQPLLQLPPSHHLWDEAAAQLPEMFRRLNLRPTLASMPILSAAAADLPDAYLLRASAIISIFAHAYHYVEPQPYNGIPESVQRPWVEISRRLQQPAPHLSFIDLNLYNWRLLHPDHPDPMSLENLALLIPILGNEDERRFQMTPTEMMARFAPLLTAVLRAQEAVNEDKPARLKQELRFITDSLQSLSYDTFMKVNPNSHSPFYVNPVVWGKTVAPLATPFQESGDIPGPSGTAIPAFQLLDILFGRQAYTSSIGHETTRARRWFPPHWQAFLQAAEAVSVLDYVRNSGDVALQNTFQAALDAYAGETGLLGRHRLKTYGFLDLSFKAGRSKTLGGFAGDFDARMWDKMDEELERARQERYARYPQICHFVTVKAVTDIRADGDKWVKQIALDTRGAGLRCQPGDRCAILPQNEPELVEKTVRALRGHGDEPIQLNGAWREAVKMRDGYQQAKVLSLRALLTFGRIRPVSRPAAKALYALTHNETLWRILEARAEDQWELWDLLEMLAQAGFDTRRLWRAEPGEPERICHLAPPESFRTYSITSLVIEPGTEELAEIHLMVGRLQYQTPATAVSQPATRFGVGSSFLARLGDTPERRIAIKLIHPPRFSLPPDSRRPIVMFAGGTGLAPFRSLLQARLCQPDSGENWLFFGTRTPHDLYYRAELEQLAAQGKVQLRAAFSRAEVGLMVADGRFTFPAGPRQYIHDEMVRDENAQQLWRLLQSRQDGGLGACFYVCGHTNFAQSVMQGMQTILARFAEGDEAARQTKAQQTLYRLVGEDRYMQEIFTTYAGAQFDQKPAINASEVIGRNNDAAGYWAIINGRVYDLSTFAHLHPGGLKIIRSYAGMDATAAYRAVLHDVNPEVDAMLGLYEIGVVRRLDFGQAWGVVVSPTGLQLVTLHDAYRTWMRLLYQVVEMENAVANDFSAREEPVTHDESPGELSSSFYRQLQYLQSHGRFRREYQAKITGELLPHLWRLASGLCAENLHVRWLEQALTAVQQSAAAQQAAAWEEALPARLHAAAAAGALAELDAACRLLEAADKQFLRAVRLALRAGVQLFEQYESRTLVDGREALLALTQQFPQLLAAYYAALVHRNINNQNA